MPIYYRLIDPQNHGMIVRIDKEKQHRYVPGKGWVETGIMLDYFWPDSDLYDRYEEISERVALELTGGVT